MAATRRDGRENILVPFPPSLGKTPVATHCRSTVLVASIQALKQHGWFDAYKRAAPPDVLDAIENAVAGAWLPIELAIAHYTTCDSLGVSVLEQLDIGAQVVTRLQQTLLGTLARAAGSTLAASPLTVLSRFNQLHARSWVGSGGRVVELGPKDLRLDVVGLPLVHIAYFRTSYRGFLRAGARFFAENAFVTEIPASAPHAVSYRFAWV